MRLNLVISRGAPAGPSIFGSPWRLPFAGISRERDPSRRFILSVDNCALAYAPNPIVRSGQADLSSGKMAATATARDYRFRIPHGRSDLAPADWQIG